MEPQQDLNSWCVNCNIREYMVKGIGHVLYALQLTVHRGMPVQKDTRKKCE